MTNIYYQLQPTVVTTGASCSGTEGTGRTYSLPNAPATYYGMSILLQGSPLTYGIDFTVSGQTITFLVYVENSMIISINYYTISNITPTLGIGYTVPEYVQAEIRSSTAFSSSTLPTFDDVQRFINEASREIDIISNQLYSPTVVTSELHDFSGLQDIFQFPIAGLLSIQKVEYNVNGPGVAPSWIELIEGADADYLIYLQNNEIQFVSGSNGALKTTPKYGLKRFRMSYTYGSTTVPFEIEHLCTLMAAKRVISTLINYQANTKQGAISVGPIRVADPSTFGISFLKQMNDDIIKLRHDIGLDTKIYKSTRVYDTNVPGYVNGGYYGGGYYG